MHERYSSLVGHKRSWSNSGSWLARLLGGGGKDAQQLALGPGGSKSHQNIKRDAVRRDLQAVEHKYFFAINLYNSFDVIPDIFATLFRTAAVLGYHNVFVSIYENGSNDQTKALLRICDALARTVGLRIIIRTSMRTRGAFNHRIEYLAEVRNAAMVPLHELRDNENEVFDTIVFMNDILPCVDDLLELIWQSRRQNAGITCASDYMYHDDIVSQPVMGTADTRVPRCSMITGWHGISTARHWKTRRSSKSFIILCPTTVSSVIYPSKVSEISSFRRLADVS